MKETIQKQYKRQGFRVGILGSGQLARMLALSCHQLGLTPIVLAQKSSDPAAQVCPKVCFSIKELFKLSDVVTFESEFFDADELALLPAKERAKIFPDLAILKKIQFRNLQKKLLQDYRVPTLSALSVKNISDLKSAYENLGHRFVLKKNFGGYDGYGTFYSQSKKDFLILKNKLNEPHGFIAEPWVSIKKELACVFARDQQGFQTNFPLVETIQQKSKCSIIMGPLKHPAFPRLKKRIQKMLEETNYVGCLGVEMFAVGNELIVNELAPRVHNTAHFSQNALLCSQFDLHIKAVSGFSIKSELLPFENFCMINLLGTGKPFVKIPANHSGALHMYGKSQSMDGRKMGHINFVGKKSLKKLKSLAEAQREKFVL